MRLNLKIYILSLISLSLLLSCESDRYTEPVPDVRHIQPEFNVHRVDLSLAMMDTLAIADGLKQLRIDQPQFSDLLLNKIIQLNAPGMSKEEYADNVEAFLTDPRIKFLIEKLLDTYPESTDFKSQFTPGFQYAEYYFPDKETPDIYTYFSEYSIANFIFSDPLGKDALAIGLDFYLGADHPYAQLIPNHTGFSNYLTRAFNSEHIVSRTMLSWIEDWKSRPDGTRVLDHMIFEGQKLYVLDKLLPHISDTAIFSFTADQLEWAQNNELEMWAHFIDENVLYDEQNHIIQRYTQPAPFTRGMPRESPGRTGAYIGYKIIESFMRKNKEYSLSDLIGLDDPQMIYDKSRYRPR